MCGTNHQYCEWLLIRHFSNFSNVCLGNVPIVQSIFRIVQLLQGCLSGWFWKILLTSSVHVVIRSKVYPMAKCWIVLHSSFVARYIDSIYFLLNAVCSWCFYYLLITLRLCVLLFSKFVLPYKQAAVNNPTTLFLVLCHIYHFMNIYTRIVYLQYLFSSLSK